ncbi:Uncharacterized protein HZ326_23760 [Fusarium oxysporum f. sp. albedinis]|nr:Uncharacterized protein HZ326_23760 [Fusarium oxysporum f. sp. albedinis]
MILEIGPLRNIIVLPNMNMTHIVLIAKNPIYWHCDNTPKIFHVTPSLYRFCTILVALLHHNLRNSTPY